MVSHQAFSVEQGKGYEGFAGVGDLFEETGFELVGKGHFAGGNLRLSGADEAEFAMGEGGLIVHAGIDANGRAEDAAGHRTCGVDVAEAAEGVEGGAGCVVGEVFKAGAVGIGLAEDAGFKVAGEVGRVGGDPVGCAAFERGCQGWV